MDLKKVYLALDTSYKKAIMAIFDENNIYFKKFCDEKNRHAPIISEYINEAFVFAENNNIKITHIASGLGPGSFVGIRVSLATILGLGFRQEYELFGFDSHLGLLCSVDNVKENNIVLTKACGELYYMSIFKNFDQIQDKVTIKIYDFINRYNYLKNTAVICDENILELNSYFDDIKIIEGITENGLKKICYFKTISDLKPIYVSEPHVKKFEGKIL